MVLALTAEKEPRMRPQPRHPRSESRDSMILWILIAVITCAGVAVSIWSASLETIVLSLVGIGFFLLIQHYRKKKTW